MHSAFSLASFENVLAKTNEACNNAGADISDHFTGISKTIPIPKGVTKEMEDFMFTRYDTRLTICPKTTFR